MKELWYFTTMLLLLAVLAGFSNMTTPTNALIANIPPEWDFPSTEFHGTDFRLNLNELFFDPDGDTLTFGASPSEGIMTSTNESQLHIKSTTQGTITLIATDGKATTYQKITITP